MFIYFKRRFTMKKRLTFVLSALILGCSVLTACQSSSGQAQTQAAAQQAAPAASSEEAVTIKVANVDPEDAPSHLALTKFKEYVEEKCPNVTVELYANGVLGGERETTEATSLGNLDITIVSASVLAAYGDKYNLLDFPFLFKDNDAVKKALDGELGALYGGWCEEHNLKVIGWDINSFRGLQTNVPVHTAADLKGLKIRAIESDMFVTLFKLLGANPTPMSYTEIYTALEQGTIDGHDVPAPLTMSSKFYEQSKYYTFTNHCATVIPLLITKSTFEKYSPELQTAVLDGAKLAMDYLNQCNIEDEQKAAEVFKDAGMEVIYLNDEERKTFSDAVAPMYEDYAKVVGQDVLDLALSFSK